MGLKCSLLGLPNAGKSTIFNALTNQGVEASAYPFCTIDPHIGIVSLKDSRLSLIQELYHSRKSTFATLEFVDIAGLVRGASLGEGLGNQFLSHIQRVDLIAHIVRFFEDKNVSHPCGPIDPIRDITIVTNELILKDNELRNHGSIKALHDLGAVRIHEKQYLVEDGDLIYFLTQRHTRKE